MKKAKNEENEKNRNLPQFPIAPFWSEIQPSGDHAQCCTTG